MGVIKFFFFGVILINTIFGFESNAQKTSNNSNIHQEVYLLHLKFYASWPWRYEKAPKFSPKYVLSLDTMHIEVNSHVKYSSPGLKREPAFSNGIITDVVAVKFPQGDTLSVRFCTSFDRFPNYSIRNRTWDTTFTITNDNNKQFFFIANRGTLRKGKNNYQLFWQLFDNQNTRKQLTRRLQKKLIQNTVHTITLE
jgi:hypothetical protein